MAKQILFDDAARQKMRTGIEKLAKTVRVTLGPAGRNVILQKSFGGPHVTKDGVSVAKEVELEDPFENMGAKLVLEVASKTNDVAGDGTTTATVLASAVFTEGLKYVTTGVSTIALRNGIDKATQAASEAVLGQARKVKTRDDKLAVAAISANNDPDVGGFIADAFEAVGDDGVITVEENKAIETELEVVEGMEFDKGYLSPYFATNMSKLVCEFEDANVLICNSKISNVREFIPALEAAAQTGRPLLVIAEDVEGEALATLVINRLRGSFPCVAVKAPGFGDRRTAMMQDIATLTGATPVMESTGATLEGATVKDLGKAKKVIVSKDFTTIVEGAGKKGEIKGRIDQIKGELENTKSDYDAEKLQERLAKLSGGVAQINVGAATESEMKEKKARVEDALHATRAAVEEGIVPGGGTALLSCIDTVEKMKLEGDERVGAMIVRRALEAPLRQISTNAGQDGAVVVQNVRAGKGAGYGYNAGTDTYEDLVKAGVIDPTKVVRSALQNAASVAGLLLTTDALVSEVPGADKEPAAGGHAH